MAADGIRLFWRNHPVYPVACWATAILIINEVPDVEADRRANKRTLVVRWAEMGARVIYRSLRVIALGAAGVAVAIHALPTWFVLPAVALAAVGMIAASRIAIAPAARRRLKQEIELTLAIQAADCSVLGIALLLDRFL